MPKIIQTFWASKTQENALLNSGGFLCPEIHYMSWSLSCLQLLKFYPEVELHTNTAGKEILIDLLGLPYTKVHLSLETEFMYNLLPNMWAYCKIHTYSIQNQPFLHIDGDVFIWKPFKNSLIQSPLIAQNIDENLQVYEHCLEIIKKQAPFIPEWLRFEKNQIRAYNAGIIGGNNISFFKEFSRLAFEFYDKNNLHFNKLNNDNKNIHIVPEQFLPYVLSRKWNIDVILQNDKIVNPSNGEFNHFFEIDKIPFEESYMHVLGNSKRSKIHNDFVSFVLKQEYPEVWQKIISIYQERNCLSAYIKRQLQMQKYAQKTVLPQAPNSNEDYKNSKFFCKLFDIDFVKNKEDLYSNPKLYDLFLFESKIIEFNQKSFLKSKTKISPFPNYKSVTDVFKQKTYEDYYIHITPCHEIITTKFEWSKYVNTIDKLETEKMTPFKSMVLLYLDMNYYSTNTVWLNDSLFHLFEKLKSSPNKIVDLLNSKELQLNDDSENNILLLLKKWYAYGIIHLSKSNTITQKPSNIYIKQQLNIKKQISSCLNFIINFYQIEDYNPLLISQFDELKKTTSLQEIINILKELNFEANGVRGTINNLSAITPPVITQIKLRGYLKLYVIITKVTDYEVTIYNTELMEEEIYSKEYFSTIWDGILILISQKQ